MVIFHSLINTNYFLSKSVFLLLTIIILNGTFVTKKVEANTSINNRKLEKAFQLLETGNNKDSILLFQEILDEPSNHSLIFEAGVHNALGRAYSQSHNYLLAITHWESAKKIYRQTSQKSILKELFYTSFYLGQTYLTVGDIQEAILNFKQAKVIAQNLNLNRELIVTNGSLGQAHLDLGEYDRAIALFKEVLQQAQSQENTVKTLNNLTIAYQQRAKKNTLTAREVLSEGNNRYYERLKHQEAKDLATAKTIARRAFSESLILKNESTVRAWLNWRELDSGDDPAPYRNEIVKILNKLPPTRSKAFLAINLGKLDRNNPLPSLLVGENTAKEIGDRAALSYVLLEKGKFYRQQRQLDLAESNIKQGVLVGLSANESHALYELYWNLALIKRSTGDIIESKKAYGSAIANLQQIRGDIALESFRGQLNFRDEIEPIFREYLEILLDLGEIDPALDLFAQLRLFQLQALYGDNCSDIGEIKFVPFDFLKETNSGLVTTIVLEDLIYVILQLPGSRTIVESQPIEANNLLEEIQQWRASLELKHDYGYLNYSKKFYDLLIRPLSSHLKTPEIKNLVFVQDRSLKNISPAVLYDRKREEYLIERYGITLSLGLSYNSIPEIAQKPSMLAFGLTESYQGFPPLPNVALELDNIKQLLDIDIFLDRDFTKSNLTKQVEELPLSILHLATHAQFGGTLDTAFILASDKRFNLKEFESVLDRSVNPIDLLVLSACATAVGNDRSLLGLAGVALRSGVISTLGTLWYVDDKEIAEFMIDFYRFLEEPGSNAVVALQKAQIEQIKKPGSHPALWSALALIQ
ncbi:MAG: CHAT domain-containing protein [Prochloraceae cyanobacterium]